MYGQTNEGVTNIKIRRHTACEDFEDGGNDRRVEPA